MADYSFQTVWSSSETKFRVELDEGSGYEIKADNLVAYFYTFTTSVLSISIKITPYIDDVLTPGEAKVETFTIPPTPINLQATNDGIDVTLTWDAVPSADFYALRIDYEGETVWIDKVDTNSTVMKITSISDWIDNIDVSISVYISTSINEVIGSESSEFVWSYSSFAGIFCKTFNDAIVSGASLIIRFQDQTLGTYYYAKVYPTISASNNGTIDDIGKDLQGINDAILSGIPKLAKIESGGNEYYIKIYPIISAEVVNSIGITLPALLLNDAILSGTPRVARVQLNSVYYYLKVYPTKA